MAENWVTQHTLSELIEENKYKVEESTKYLSRCIDGRYTGQPLEPLAIPGADAGENAIMIATLRQYGIQVDTEKVTKLFIELVGGPQNVRFHTDSHAEKGIVCAGCGHMRGIFENPDKYGLLPEDVLWIRNHLVQAKKDGAREVVLEGAHQEQAVLILEGTTYSIYPSLGNRQVFVFHRGLVDQRHRAVCKLVVEKKAVVLPEGCDDEYLYEIVSEVTEDHLMETAKKLAAGLPMYSVHFKDNGSFTLESLGKVA